MAAAVALYAIVAGESFIAHKVEYAEFIGQFPGLSLVQPHQGRMDDKLFVHSQVDGQVHGFDETDAAVLETVDLVKNHPLVPKDVVVKGYIMDSVTGELTPIENQL